MLYISKHFHVWNMVPMSPYPVVSSLIGLTLMSSTVYFFKFSSSILMNITLFIMVVAIFSWGNSVSYDMLVGKHTSKVTDNLKIGMILFIFSEALFFIAWFWAFFHHSWVPNVESGMVWVPFNIEPMKAFQLPLLNTLILLSSGVSVTLAHYKLMNNMELELFMIIGILLGVLFTCCQLLEYYEAKFTISDSVFGSCFFVTTGFHGLHVLIGSIFLMLVLKWSFNKELSSLRFLSMEFALWYWHFVDVVWLFLFTFFYWWSSN